MVNELSTKEEDSTFNFVPPTIFCFCIWLDVKACYRLSRSSPHRHINESVASTSLLFWCHRFPNNPPPPPVLDNWNAILIGQFVVYVKFCNKRCRGQILAELLENFDKYLKAIIYLKLNVWKQYLFTIYKIMDDFRLNLKVLYFEKACGQVAERTKKRYGQML